MGTKWAGHAIGQVHFVRPEPLDEPDRRLIRSSGGAARRAALGRRSSALASAAVRRMWLTSWRSVPAWPPRAPASGASTGRDRPGRRSPERRSPTRAPASARGLDDTTSTTTTPRGRRRGAPADDRGADGARRRSRRRPPAQPPLRPATNAASAPRPSPATARPAALRPASGRRPPVAGGADPPMHPAGGRAAGSARGGLAPDHRPVPGRPPGRLGGPRPRAQRPRHGAGRRRLPDRVVAGRSGARRWPTACRRAGRGPAATARTSIVVLQGYSQARSRQGRVPGLVDQVLPRGRRPDRRVDALRPTLGLLGRLPADARPSSTSGCGRRPGGRRTCAWSTTPR